MKKICTVHNCERPVRGRGFCGAHLQRQRRGQILERPVKTSSERLINLAGQRIGLLTVLEKVPPRRSRPSKWICACDCGTVREFWGQHLRGTARSCGCINGHGLSNTVEYAIWRGIINRCENPSVYHFPKYGGNGIAIHPLWRKDFTAFLAEIGPRPSPKHSVDRIDNARGYEPGNVRWATQRVQANNRTATMFVVYRGKSLPLAEAVRAAGSIVHIECARGRILRCRWPVERALETPRLRESGNSKPNAKFDSRKAEVRGAVDPSIAGVGTLRS